MDLKSDQRGRRGALYRFAPVVLWIGVIFFLSSDNGSMSETSRFVEPLLHWLFPTASQQTIQIYHFYIRKTAHVTEYGILALIAFWSVSSMASLAWSKYRYVLPILLVAAIASIDEFNQSFEPSRTSSPYDVLLDLSGGIGALILLWVVLRLQRLIRRPAAASGEA
jgi:VanZ family protein